MKRSKLALPVLGLVALAGCATYDDRPSVSSAPPAPAAAAQIVSQPSQPPISGAIVAVPAVTVTPPTPVLAYRTGTGVITNIQLLPASPELSSTVGAPQPASGAYRMTVRMDDGTTQVIDQNNRLFLIGDRVQITSDGRFARY